MIVNPPHDPFLKTKICRRWANRCCPHSDALCRFAHGPHDRHRRPTKPKRKPCKGGGLIELRQRLPHGDVGRYINSFLFATHPDALEWQQQHISTQRQTLQSFIENCSPPQRLTFKGTRRCYCCDASDVDTYHRYYYPNCFNWKGWIFCKQCKPAMENVVIPLVYEERGDLPPSCFSNIKKQPFFFDRVSRSRPSKNGPTKCTFNQDDGPVFRVQNGEFLCTVSWTDEEAVWTKTVPLRDVLRVSKERWPSIRSFLREFNIRPTHPYITPTLYIQWLSFLQNTFATRV